MCIRDSLYTNQEYGAVNQMLEKLDLDVIGFTEFDQEKAGKLSVLAKYPFKSFDGEQNTGKQIAIYSKYQIENEIKRDEANELIKTETNNILGSIISAKVNKGGSSYRVVFLHTPAPINNLLWERRNSSNKALPFFLENFEKEQVVVMGDFNTSPWSPHFVKLEDKTGLNYFNPLKGKGSLFTWSKDGGKTEFYKPLSVHIDHIFISKNLYLVDSGVDEKAGSDHNLVWVEVK
jgi:endonuclease/exonuclease/phosphatase (EEP) superfamily protein YafD